MVRRVAIGTGASSWSATARGRLRSDQRPIASRRRSPHTLTARCLRCRQCSSGTLRILALTVLPYLTRRPAVIITEEPENGIHPKAVEAVLQSLQSIEGSQVLISSHSPVVLAASKLDQVLCARLEPNGAANIVR